MQPFNHESYREFFFHESGEKSKGNKNDNIQDFHYFLKTAISNPNFYRSSTQLGKLVCNMNGQ